MVDPDGGGTIGRLVGRPSRRAASAESDQPVVGPVLTRRISHGRSAEVSSTDSFADALAFASGDADHLALSVVPNPTPEILADLGSAWGLHDLLVEDLVHAHQRPKLERYGDVQFLVVRSARYIDASEEVEFSEFHVLLRSRAVVVVCQDHRLVDGTVITADMSPSDQALLGVGTPLVRQEHLLKLGAEGMVYQLLDAIVDGYVPVLDGLQVDLEQIEHQVFSGDTAAAERIYRLSQEVIDLLHATSALARIVQSLLTGADRDAVPQRRAARGARPDPRCERDPGRAAAERGHEEDLVLGGDPVRADPGGRRLRDELRRDAGTALGARLPVRLGSHACFRDRAVRGLQTEEVVVGPEEGREGCEGAHDHEHDVPVAARAPVPVGSSPAEAELLR
jgi:hypothetical protein